MAEKETAKQMTVQQRLLPDNTVENDKLTSQQQCSACGIAGSYRLEVTLCPLCGGTLQKEPIIKGDERIEMLIPFAAAQCPSCGMTTLLQRHRQCAGCGAPLNEEARSHQDESVKQRRRAFKVRIQRLRERLEDSKILQPIFTSEGQEISLPDYINTIILPAIETFTTLMNEVREQLRTTTWNAQDPSCLSSFQKIVTALEQVISQVVSLVNQLPPLEARAIHRIATRAMAHIIHGNITFIEILIASSSEEVLEPQRKGQELLTRGEHTLGSLSRIIHRVSKQASPGWWMSGDILDLAIVAWEGVENTSTTINQAADMVRATLAMIPGVAQLGDAEALSLLPTMVLPVTFADSSLLQQRACLIHDVLTKADAIAPHWIQDANELVLRIAKGIRVANEQVERLGFAATGPSSRRMTLQLLIDIYGKLVEGPLRDLGSVAVVATRAAEGQQNGTYLPEVARGVQAGDVVQQLAHLGVPWRDAATMLIRNAEAHGGVDVQDAGVALTQRRIENGVVVDEETVHLNDAEFAEEFARVNETCLALQLGIVPWLFTHSSASLVQARQVISPTQQEREDVVRLLAGLQGLLQVVIECHDNTLLVRAVVANGVDASSPQITYLVPAIFHNWADLDAVTLHISSRPPVTYQRAELPAVDPLTGTLDPVAVAFMGRRWLGDLSGNAATAVDITYLVRPQLGVLLAAFKHMSVSPASIERIAEAHRRVVALTTLWRDTPLPSPSTSLVSEVRAIALDAARRLDRLYWAFRGNDTREQQRQARSCAALITQIEVLQQRGNDELVRMSDHEPEPEQGSSKI